ncbi:hypothetical protein IP88_07945 [alpha proteobacterium AAP81b]|nr:hypothetical protein IP88_07945 [alpha proteobacterium AAP81b]
MSGLALFFTCTTVLAFVFPLAKLVPFWLDRRIQRQVAFHRAAAAAIAEAMPRNHNDPAHYARLATQLAYHRGALAALAPERAAPTIEQRDAA